MVRPKMKAGEAREARVVLRVRVSERERWTRAATRLGQSLSEWLRGLAEVAAPAPKRGAK